MKIIRIVGVLMAATVLAAGLTVLLLSGALTSRAVQNPSISLDMVTTGNSYDETTNTMTVGAVDHCLATAPPGNAATHLHQSHLIIQNVEDLIAWQVRFNYIGDQMRINTINFTPFTDNNTGQNIAFTNLPIDSTSSLHRTVTSAGGVGPPAPPDGSNTPDTHLAAATYDGLQGFAISADTPAKSVPDDTSYSAPTGGVLAAVGLQVLGDESTNTLTMDLDDDVPNPPGSRAVVFTATGNIDMNLAETSLGDGQHVEGGVCQAATPTPTPPPTPTPTASPGPPTPTPGPKGSFDPHVSASYSSTAPGSHPDIAGTFDVGLGPDGQPNTPDDTGDYNFAGIVNFSPSSPADADVPDGAVVGSLQSVPSWGILNNSCVNQIPVAFTFMEGTTDINNTVEPLPYGQNNDLAIIAGDTPPIDGVQDVKPPPAVTKYPSFLNAIFDPDWVDFGPDRIAGNADDNNGPQPPIKPRSRSVGVTPIRPFGNLWVVRQELVFEPGTKLPNLPPFDPSLGYPSVTVIQQASASGFATSPAPSATTDFCTPLKENSLSSGVSGDNPDTPANEGGLPLRTLPSQPATPIASLFYAFSQRDADRDGYENTLDTCPFHFDSVWSPRDQTPPREGDSDVFFGFPAPDGIPDTCDPTPNEPSFPPGGQPVDHDGDGFLNAGDNCPLQSNPDQADRDKNADGEEIGDGIGDVCDTPGTDPGFDSGGRPIPGPRTVSGNGPLVPDGDSITCVRTLTITVGGPPQAAVSECLQTLPSPSTPTPTPTPTPPRIPLTLNVNKRGTVSRDGFRVGLGGTLSCTAGHNGFLNVNAFQFVRGQVLLNAFGFASFSCSGVVQSWAATAESFIGFFKPGHANVRVTLSTFGPGGFDQKEVATQVRLRRGEPPPESPPQSPPVIGQIAGTAGTVGGAAVLGLLAAGMTFGFVRVVRRNKNRDDDF